MRLRVTVCELREEPAAFAEDWAALVAHARAEASELVLLPELGFSRWFASTRAFKPEVWRDALRDDAAWQPRLRELAPARVAGTRPLQAGRRRLNEAFVWSAAQGRRAAHQKRHLPDDEGYWEASWYQRGPADFSLCGSRSARMGFLICTELWFFERARAYGRAGAHLLLVPRTTGQPSVERWLTGGRTAAIVSGAFCLSSNRVGAGGPSPEFGGCGWLIDPEGDVIATTSRAQPFVTREIDLADAVTAKRNYPRYVRE